jgi:hypothetical protein
MRRSPSSRHKSPSQSRAAGLIEDQLAQCRAVVAAALAEAAREPDEYARQAAYDRAIAFLAMTAKLGGAFARMCGEFNQNISVIRTVGEGGPSSRDGSNGS